MAYDNPEHRRNVRHTVRFKAADYALISVLADRLGMQKATLIEDMAIRQAEAELQAFCTALGTAQRSTTSGMSASRAACPSYGLTRTGQAQKWPTPRATDGTKGGPNQAGSKWDLMLPSAAAQWPTPASRNYRTPNSEASQASRTHSGGEQLPNCVEHHFSHPVLSTYNSRMLSPPGRTLPRRLNPAFVCWLMGWPIWTNPRSPTAPGRKWSGTAAGCSGTCRTCATRHSLERKA